MTICTTTARFLFLIPALTGIASAEDNQTVLREQAGDIPSIYYDLRLEPMGVQSGLPPRWPNAMVSVSYDQDIYEWSSQSIMLNAPGAPLDPNRQPLDERRDRLALTFRQSLWTPFPWDAELEVDAAAVRRTAVTGESTVQSDSGLTSDPRILLLLPVWQERYAGVLLGGGVSIPSGEKSDWFDAPDAWGVVLTARWSATVPGIPWLTLGASGEYRWASHCTQTIYPATPPVDVTCDYRGYTVGGELTYRWTRCISTGVTLVTRGDTFQNIEVPGLAENIDESIRTTHVGAFLTVMLPKQVFWMITVKQVKGIDGWSGHNLAIGGQIALAAW